MRWLSGRRIRGVNIQIALGFIEQYLVAALSPIIEYLTFHRIVYFRVNDHDEVSRETRSLMERTERLIGCSAGREQDLGQFPPGELRGGIRDVKDHRSWPG
jgi:hypothetical protein